MHRTVGRLDPGLRIAEDVDFFARRYALRRLLTDRVALRYRIWTPRSCTHPICAMTRWPRVTEDTRRSSTISDMAVLTTAFREPLRYVVQDHLMLHVEVLRGRTPSFLCGMNGTCLTSRSVHECRSQVRSGTSCGGSTVERDPCSRGRVDAYCGARRRGTSRRGCPTAANSPAVLRAVTPTRGAVLRCGSNMTELRGLSAIPPTRQRYSDPFLITSVPKTRSGHGSDGMAFDMKRRPMPVFQMSEGASPGHVMCPTICSTCRHVAGVREIADRWCARSEILLTPTGER